MTGSSDSPLSPAAALLVDMVRIESINANVSGNAQAEKAIGDFLEKTLVSRGLKVRRIPTPGGCDNLLATYKVSDDLPWLMFESHMDTVSTAGMTIDPLGAEVREGRIWGRGACDTKGTGAAMIQAITQYMAGDKKPWNIAMVCAVDEEVGMTGVQALAKAWDTLGFVPKGVIIGEPTNLLPIITHNGSVRWKIRTIGVAAHSSNPSRGRSAISDMMRVIECMESQYIPSLKRSDDLTGKAQCSVNMIEGGVQYNIIPEHCEIRLDRRVVPGEDLNQVIRDVEKVLEKLPEKFPELRYKQELVLTHPPLTRKNNGQLVEYVQKTLRHMAMSDQLQGAAFCTDGGDLDEAQIPCVVIGPGDVAQAHTKDEWLDLAELEKGVDVYLGLLQQTWA